MAALAAGLAAPFLYDGWNPDAAAVALATFLIWCAVAGITHMLMTQVRTQRHRMRRGAAEAREEARVDGLTGIGNRRAFEEAIANRDRPVGPHRECRSAWRWGTSRGSSGSTTAGATSRVTPACETSPAASRTRCALPDRCFRWGGDEFALLLPGTGAEGAAQVASGCACTSRPVRSGPTASP